MRNKHMQFHHYFFIIPVSFIMVGILFLNSSLLLLSSRDEVFVFVRNMFYFYNDILLFFILGQIGYFNVFVWFNEWIYTWYIFVRWNLCFPELLLLLLDLIFSCNDETDLGCTSFTNSMTLILVWFYFCTFLCHLLFENIPNL